MKRILLIKLPKEIVRDKFNNNFKENGFPIKLVKAEMRLTFVGDRKLIKRIHEHLIGKNIKNIIYGVKK